MKELSYPEEFTEDQIYESVRSVMNRRGYTDRNGDSEALYDSGQVTVQVAEDVLELEGPSGSEEELLVSLLEPALQN